MNPLRTLFPATAFAVCALVQLASAATLTVDPRAAETATTFSSLSKAVARLRAGDTLLIADGVYRETIDLRHLRGQHGGQTVIAALSGARPIIKGSDIVTGWRRIGADLYAREWDTNSQQVFVNDMPLKQIGGLLFGGFPHNPKHPLANLHRSQGGIWPGRNGDSRDHLVDNSFYFDGEARTLYIRSANLAPDHGVEVSVRPYLVIGADIDSVAIRGLRFEHANTTAHSQSGAIALQGRRLALEDVHVRHVDGSGIDLTGDDNLVARSSANYCGSVGMKVRGRRAQLVDNETSFNNTRGFNKWWEAGGAKFVGSGGLQDSEVRGHRAYANNGDGLWFDWRNDNNRVHANVVAYNRGMGIHYEASRRASIHGNYVAGNSQRGIYLPNSAHSTIVGNLIVGNGMEGIAIVDERHAAAQGEADLVPSGNRVSENALAWNGKAALVSYRDTESNQNVFVGATPPGFSYGWPTRDRPLLATLQSWQSQSSQDLDSLWRPSPMSDVISHALAAHESFAAMRHHWRDWLNTLMPHPAAKRVAAEIGRIDSEAAP